MKLMAMNYLLSRTSWPHQMWVTAKQKIRVGGDWRQRLRGYRGQGEGQVVIHGRDDSV